MTKRISAGLGVLIALAGCGPQPGNRADIDQNMALPPVRNVTVAESPGSAEQTYIRDHMRLYDLRATYRESMLDGRVPGVTFKIKNEGNRTLHRVTVLVVFKDAQGNSIAEEEFNPVIYSPDGISQDRPLRPGYIWQNEIGRFYMARHVPSEWQSGAAEGRITEIEFGD